MKRFRGLTYALLAAIILVAAAGHLGAASPTPAPAASPYLIDISNNAFSPSSLSVPAGSTVTWKNDDPYAHTVTMSGKGGFDSGNLDSGKTFSNTFSKAGTYYVCLLDSSLDDGHDHGHRPIDVTFKKAVSRVAASVRRTATSARLNRFASAGRAPAIA